MKLFHPQSNTFWGAVKCQKSSRVGSGHKTEWDNFKKKRDLGNIGEEEPLTSALLYMCACLPSYYKGHKSLSAANSSSQMLSVVDFLVASLGIKELGAQFWSGEDLIFARFLNGKFWFCSFSFYCEWIMPFLWALPLKLWLPVFLRCLFTSH